MGTPDQPLVTRSDRDGIALVELNRPGQRNSLRYESWTELADISAAISSDDDVRGVVLAGAGGFFSAGGDLKSGPAHGSGPLGPAGRVEHAQRVMERLKAIPVPVVAAVEGAAVGLGWSLALSCDLVVAGADAFFAAPFVARAVVPDGGLAWRLTQQLGRHRAGTFLLRGERLTAAAALDLGLVNEVVATGSAVARAEEIAGELARCDPGAIEMTKRLITASEAAALATFQPLELALATVAQLRPAAGDARNEI